jgi:hypothetical protein
MVKTYWLKKLCKQSSVYFQNLKKWKTVFLARKRNGKSRTRLKMEANTKNIHVTDSADVAYICTYLCRYECAALRPILNFAPRGKIWPPGVKLSLRGEFCPLGVKLSLGGEILCLPLHSSAQYVNSVHPRGWTKGWTSPLGNKFHAWGPGVKNGPLAHLASSWWLLSRLRIFACLKRSGKIVLHKEKKVGEKREKKGFSVIFFRGRLKMWRTNTLWSLPVYLCRP